MLAWQFEETPSCILLRYRSAALGGRLRPEELREITVPPIPVDSSKPLVLSGQGPGWLIAYLSTRFMDRVVAIDFPLEGQRAYVVSDVSADVIAYGPVSRRIMGNSAVSVKVLPRNGYNLLWYYGGVDKLDLSRLRSIPLPDGLNRKHGVCIVTGLAQVLLVRLVLLAKNAGFPWVGVFQIQLGRSVVVWSEDPQMRVGDLVPSANQASEVAILPFAPATEQKPPARIAIAIIGPPDCGKSILSLGIQENILGKAGYWLYRANPDGEGLWRKYAEHLPRHEYGWGSEPTDQRNLGDQYVAAISIARRICDMMFIDTGGRMSDELRRILECCASESNPGFFIFLGRNTLEYRTLERKWIEFAQATGARHLASVYSELDAPHTTIQHRSDGVIEAIVPHLDRQRLASTIAESCRPLLEAIHFRSAERNQIL